MVQFKGDVLHFMKGARKRRPTNHPVVLDFPRVHAPAEEIDVRCDQVPAAAAEVIQAGTNVHIAGANDQAQGLTAAVLAASRSANSY